MSSISNSPISSYPDVGSPREGSRKAIDETTNQTDEAAKKAITFTIKTLPAVVGTASIPAKFMVGPYLGPAAPIINPNMTHQ